MPETIHSPRDLKKLPIRALPALAEEIRGVIIETVNARGGHLASNLGAVELTIALHYALDLPADKLIFDVGHQSYAHKLLTGRGEAFKALRTEGGAGGFPSMAESEYDGFTGGHASNAISAAVGMARARRMRGERHAIAALVGDGAMTGGMCYEAMNDAGQLGEPLLVILNDNEMSISKNVGALSSYLTSLRKSAAYVGAKRAFKRGLNRIPFIGPPIVRGVDAIKRTIRGALLRDQFFGKLGFEYYGPIDGHDIPRLIRAIRKVMKCDGPALLHAVTSKGRGYTRAEADPGRFHGVAPHFVDARGPEPPAERTNGEIAAELLLEMADADPAIAVITAAMPVGTGMAAFQRRNPRRAFDVGIAEGHMVAMAAGLAAAGAKPYVAAYSTFLQRGYDQLIHDACIAKLPVTFLIDRCGLVGADGATHQGAYDLSYLTHMPGMIVAAPRSAADLRRLIRLSAHAGGPMAIRYPREFEKLGAAYDSGSAFRLGEWEELAAGRDAAILALGQAVPAGLRAAGRLTARGISCAVIDARFVKPLDEATLSRVAASVPLIATLEENALSGGFGSAVRMRLCEAGSPPATICFGIPDEFIGCATIQRQRELCGLTGEAVAERILQKLSELGRAPSGGGREAG